MNRRNFLKFCAGVVAVVSTPVHAAPPPIERGREIYIFRSKSMYDLASRKHGRFYGKTDYVHPNIEKAYSVGQHFVVVARKPEVLSHALPSIYGFLADAVYNTTTKTLVRHRDNVCNQTALIVAEGRA